MSDPVFSPARAVALVFPLRGTWKLFHIPGHHKNAYDFVGLEERTCAYLRRNVLRNMLWGGSPEDWYGWSRPVFAPASGTVVQTGDGWPDRQKVGFAADFLKFFVLRRTPSPIAEDPRSVVGNFVAIALTDDTLVLLCHLKKGSVRVASGGRVEAGDRIGEVGNSGNSFSPHLHMNLFSHMSAPLTGPAILRHLSSGNVPAFRFDRIEERMRGRWRQCIGSIPRKGSVVRYQ